MYTEIKSDLNACDTVNFHIQLHQTKNSGSGSGDPHYLTIDGRYYTFNGYGEFVLLEALSETLTETEFTMQGRLASIRQWRVTTQQSLAFGTSSSAFHVSTNT